MAANSDGLRLQVQRLDNGTFIATFLLSVNDSDNERSLESLLNPRRPPYDDEGALYYVIVVICIYGLSIILMIASLVRKNKKDNGIINYMKDMDKVRRLERRQQKYKTRLMMQKKRPKNATRYNRSTFPRPNNSGSDAERSRYDDLKSPSLEWQRPEVVQNPCQMMSSSGADHDSLMKSTSDPGYGTKAKVRSSLEPGAYCYTRTLRPLERGSDTEMLINWEDGSSLTPEPPSPSLAVLKEEEEEGENKGDRTARSKENREKQIIVNINNVETKLLVSIV